MADLLSLSDSDNMAFFSPLFEAAEAAVGDGYIRPLPEPAPGSTLANDDAPLGIWRSSLLVRNSWNAGISHVFALCRLVAVASHVDPNSPWTLLRGALENFSTAAWLMSGVRGERQHHALSLWAEDMRNRGQHENDTEFVPKAPGKTGSERRQEVRQVAARLSLPQLTAPKAGDIIKVAARAATLDPTETLASWRVASGFAHGRYWPLLRASDPRAATPNQYGHLIALVMADEQVKPLSDACLTLLNFVADRYAERSTGHP